MGILDGKRTYSHFVWPRKDGGPLLPRPPPCGYRPPNGIMWGHYLDEFCLYPRIPNVPQLLTVWSRSMIKEFNEIYTESLEDVAFVDPHCLKPRRRRPWPVLKVPRPGTLERAGPDDLGFVDGGSDHEEHRWEIVLADSGDYSEEEEEDGPLRFPPCLPLLEAFDKATDFKVYGKPLRTRFIIKLPPKLPESNDPDAIEAGSSDEEMEPREASTSAPVKKGRTGKKGKKARSKGKGKGKAKAAATWSRQLFSVDGIPALEEKIPSQFFPTTLIVYDPYDVSFGNTIDETEDNFGQLDNGTSRPVTYKLVTSDDMQVAEPHREERTATLYLSPENRIGSGHHSFVYSAPLSLPEPLTTFNSSSVRKGVVSVVAKVAFQGAQARELLANEGKIYPQFKDYMSDEYCGWHLISPWMKTLVPSGAVVPKFYGYYVPVDPEAPMDSEGQPISRKGRSPILLIEECGSPIDAQTMSADDRAECYSLLVRLHVEGFTHHSFHERNILVKPGPLTRPPEERSMEIPCFRVVDFGRSTYRSEDDRNDDHAMTQFEERNCTLRELRFDPIEDVL